MLQPAIELRIAALIASIVTPVLFLLVVIFQISATRATAKAARAAEREASRLRPIIRTFDPDSQLVNNKAVPGTIRFRVQNVGQETAYRVHWVASFFDSQGSVLPALKSDWELDIPPGDDMYQAFSPKHPEWSQILALLHSQSGARYELSVWYALSPSDERWYQSTHSGKSEYMVTGPNRTVVGWVWIMDKGYTLDRPVNDKT